MSIKVNPNLLEVKATEAKSLAAQLGSELAKVRSIYNSLDYKVKNRQGINSSLINLIRRIENAEDKMYNISSFLNKTAGRYNDASASVQMDSDKLIQLVLREKVVAGDLSISSTTSVSKKQWNEDPLTMLVGAILGVGIGISLIRQTANNFLVGAMVSGAKNNFVDPLIDGITFVQEFVDGISLMKSSNAGETYRSLKDSENDLTKKIEDSFITNKQAYYSGKIVGDIGSFIIGAEATAVGIVALSAGVISGAIGTAFLVTGIGEIPFYVVGAGAIAVGVPVTAYGLDTINNSRSNLKDDLALFSKTEGAGNADLLDELAKSGVKYNPDDVLAVTKTADGKLVWLENGNNSEGMQHILNHAEDFVNKGVPEDKIEELIMESLTNGKVIGYQGRGTGRLIYEVVFEGKTYDTAITVGSNGFIVGANPSTMP